MLQYGLRPQVELSHWFGRLHRGGDGAVTSSGEANATVRGNFAGILIRDF